MEKKNNGGLIVLVIILLVALLGVCGYVAYDKGLIFNKDVETNEEEKKETENKVEENNTESNYVSLEVKDEKCINSDSMVYSIRSGSIGDFQINNDNSVTLTISGLDKWGGLNYSNYETFTINNFSKKIIDVISGGIGQDVAESTVIFLMEDGSLEYLPLYCSLRNSNVKSYGSLSGVEGIVKLYSAGAFPKNSPLGGGFTILAQKSDATYYDLRSILLNTGSYNC